MPVVVRPENAPEPLLEPDFRLDRPVLTVLGASVRPADVRAALWEAARQRDPQELPPRPGVVNLGDDKVWAELERAFRAGWDVFPPHVEALRGARLLVAALGRPALVVTSGPLDAAAADATARALEHAAEALELDVTWAVPEAALALDGVRRMTRAGAAEGRTADAASDSASDSARPGEPDSARPGEPGSAARLGEPGSARPGEPGSARPWGTARSGGLGSARPGGLGSARPGGPVSWDRAGRGGAGEGVPRVRFEPILGRPHPASPGELALYAALEGSPDLAGRARYNHPVRTVTGMTPVVDVVFGPEGLGVEVDGHIFHRGPLAFAHDRERDFALLASGYRVLRLVHAEVVRDPSRALDKIRAVLGAAPGSIP